MYGVIHTSYIYVSAKFHKSHFGGNFLIIKTNFVARQFQQRS